jgi:bacteriocin-like protein
MAGNKLTIKLTNDQQNQIKNATGRKITELNIEAAAISQLSEKELDQVAGGVGDIVITKDPG